MRKAFLYFAPLLLSACTNQTAQPSEITDNSIISSQSSSSISSTSTAAKESQTENSNSTAINDFKYAVNLEKFVQEVTVYGVVEKTYSLTFTTNVSNVPTTITVNTKDLNPFGMGIYIQQEDVQYFYPISIKDIPTKEITVANTNGETRIVKVNTAITIQQNSNQQDPLQLTSNTFYLFYNKNGTISLATTYFGKSNDTMIEYQQIDTAENSSEESANNPYYDIILSAKQQQQAYIDSLEDEEMKSSVQTAYSAAVAAANSLTINHPNDEALINEALEKVLAGE